MDLSKAKIVGYLGTEPIYQVTPVATPTPPAPVGAERVDLTPPRFEYKDGAYQRVHVQDGSDRDLPPGDFCVTCMANDFIDLLEEGLDPFLDKCQNDLAQLAQVRIDSGETQLWVAQRRQDLLKKIAYGSEASIQLKALIETAVNIFGGE